MFSLNFAHGSLTAAVHKISSGRGRAVFVKNRFAIFQASPVCSWSQVSVSERSQVSVCSWRAVFVCSGRAVFVSGGSQVSVCRCCRQQPGSCPPAARAAQFFEK
ncbi:hypothetical protein MmiHf6_08400 [Methanimicrococcus hongohii]|uniref:Uncharacterized protein n=1 Tax=Methanimicrococcus hongohii TaxID=3028295 RepID=A0AA96UZG0_9EURY|nr:hypothetical protein [Methanimicrococcus sp. Hf6]WNY23532.1 hypothetical protein MmiHf6_08400 [Methanimicrococcus sp. Hf6]